MSFLVRGVIYLKRTTIGGQALIEGVMMKGPSKIGIAVRKPDKDIELKVENINLPSKKHKFLQLPFVRGVVALGEALFIGVKALMYSADFWEDETDTKGEKKPMTNMETFLIMLTSIGLTIGLFMLLPNFIASFATRFTSNVIILNLFEGVIRIAVFFIYLVYISKLEDIRRVFEYHGAEHKSIHCYEANEELTVENIKKYPIMHKRCGTSFLFMVMLVSIVVLSFFGWPNPLMRFLTRILAFPIIAGISYEVNRFMGKHENKLCSVLSFPGMMIQKYATVREPDDSQIEVAIAALKSVLPSEGEDDNW